MAHKELVTALGYSSANMCLDSGLKTSIDTLSSSAFSMATLVLIDNRLFLNAMFVDRAEHVFHADIMAFNALAPHRSVSIINAKMRNVTRGHFNQVISNDMLTPDTRLVFASAVHLNASWQKLFPYEATVLRPFYAEHAAPSAQHAVPTMRLISNFYYGEYSDFYVIDLPLRGNSKPVTTTANSDDEYLMTILLPRGNMTLARLNNRINWWSLLSHRKDNEFTCYLDLRLPRFNISSDRVFNLPLQRLGIDKAFNHLPVGRLFFPTVGMGHVRIDSIAQQVRIEVNEAGLIADAALAIGVNVHMKGEVRIVDVNRPFMFLVWHSGMQLVLFAGEVQDPT